MTSWLTKVVGALPEGCPIFGSWPESAETEIGEFVEELALDIAVFPFAELDMPPFVVQPVKASAANANIEIFWILPIFFNIKFPVPRLVIKASLMNPGARLPKFHSE